MKYDELFYNLSIVLNQTKTIAILNPNSIDAEIYKKCVKAYKLLKENGNIDKINLKGISRMFADCYGYDAPLLVYISKIEEILDNMEK